ncbi:unnamed protein product [Ectocarpus sp. 13 AM-2016]
MKLEGNYLFIGLLSSRRKLAPGSFTPIHWSAQFRAKGSRRDTPRRWR